MTWAEFYCLVRTKNVRFSYNFFTLLAFVSLHGYTYTQLCVCHFFSFGLFFFQSFRRWIKTNKILTYNEDDGLMNWKFFSLNHTTFSHNLCIDFTMFVHFYIKLYVNIILYTFLVNIVLIICFNLSHVIAPPFVNTSHV